MPIASEAFSESSFQRVKVKTALKKRQPNTNVWFFDSPKNKKRLNIFGDLPFVIAVLLEGECSVVGYEIDSPPNPFGVVEMKIHYRDKGSEVWDLKRSDKKLKKRPEVDRLITEHDFLNREILFDNWLILCAAINRCRRCYLGREAKFIVESTSSTIIRFGELLDTTDFEPSYMFAAVAMSLQAGVISADLNTELFGTNTILRRGNDERESHTNSNGLC
ncbi:hypothetical protein [Herbaspirillum autotrophicum]|uniref:hypothetical protein n=1 Tax=Herbaspirillum autotrophicum TaxID=180195 RepID=UPI000A3E1E63|nr:hypothetical protein [Herbaspirillum autotrophicum]